MKHTVWGRCGRQYAALILVLMIAMSFALLAHDVNASANQSVGPNRVMLTFGSMQDKQDFIARITNASAGTRHMLHPFSIATTYSASSYSASSSTTAAEQPTIVQDYDSFPSLALDIDPAQQPQIEAMLQNYSHASLAPVQSRVPLLMDTVRITNATGTWPTTINGVNLTGTGQGVCVIDMGINTAHEAFAGKNIVQHCFCSAQQNRSTNCCPGGLPEANSAPESYPHGSHVAGIVAANGQLKGIAPNADLVIVKVFGPDDAGQNRAYDTDIASAINWCTVHASQYHIKAISMSLGDDGQHQTYCNDDPLAPAINAAVAQNIPVVVAAGNQGSTTGISAPACVQSAIPVAFTTKSDVMSSISSRNNLVGIVAPGENIYSVNYQGGYMSMTGSSQATPHVAGAIALLAQAASDAGVTLTPDQYRTILTNTGKPITDPITGHILHRLDIRAALNSLNLFPPALNGVMTSPQYPRHNVSFTLYVNATTPLPADRRVSTVAPLGMSLDMTAGNFVYNPSNGLFSSTITMPSNAGSSLSLSATDSETSHSSANFGLTFDDTPPTVNGATAINSSGSSVSQTPPGSALTAAVQISDSLSGANGGTVALMTSQQQLTSWTLSQQIGTPGWSAHITAPTNSGNYTLVFTGLDASGNSAQTSIPLEVYSPSVVGTSAGNSTGSNTMNTTNSSTTTNTTNTTVTPPPADTTAPTTTVTLHLPNGTVPASGTWYNQPITASLSASDAGTTSSSGSSGVSGVANTYYRLGANGQWVSGTSVTVASTITDNTLYFYSIDAAGNAETAKTAQILIDTSAPAISSANLRDSHSAVVTSAQTGSQLTGVVQATDSPSGLSTASAVVADNNGQTVSTASMQLQSGQFTGTITVPATAGNYVVTFFVNDRAANTAHIDVPFTATSSTTGGSTTGNVTNVTNNSTNNTNSNSTNTSTLQIMSQTTNGSTINQNTTLKYSFSDPASGSVSIDGHNPVTFVTSSGVSVSPNEWYTTGMTNVSIAVHADDGSAVQDASYFYLVIVPSSGGNTAGNSTAGNATGNTTSGGSVTNGTTNVTSSNSSQTNMTQTNISNSNQNNSSTNGSTNGSVLTTTPACSAGAITSSCTCGGSVFTSGYCCNGGHSTSACSSGSTIGSNSGGSGGSSGGGGGGGSSSSYSTGSIRSSSSGGGSIGLPVSPKVTPAATLADAKSSAAPRSNTTIASPSDAAHSRSLVALATGDQNTARGVGLFGVTSPDPLQTPVAHVNSTDNTTILQQIGRFIPSLTDMGIVTLFVVLAGGMIVVANLKKNE